MGWIKDFFQYAWKEKKYWIIPMVLVFVILGLLIIFFQSSTVVPFVYALF